MDDRCFGVTANLEAALFEFRKEIREDPRILPGEELFEHRKMVLKVAELSEHKELEIWTSISEGVRFASRINTSHFIRLRVGLPIIRSTYPCFEVNISLSPALP